MILYCAVRRRQLISKCIPWKCCSPCLSHRFQLLCMLSVKGEGRGSVSVWVSISGSMCVCVGGVWRGVSVCVFQSYGQICFLTQNSVCACVRGCVCVRACVRKSGALTTIINTHHTQDRKSTRLNS